MSSILNSLSSTASSTASSLQQYLTFPSLVRLWYGEQHQSLAQKCSRDIVLVGPSEPFCRKVADHLLPSYQVVEVLSSMAAASEALRSIQADRSNASSTTPKPTPRHVVLGKGFKEQQMHKMRDGLGGDDSGFSWYWTPTQSGEKPPLPRKLGEEEQDMFAQKIAAHIAEVIDDVVAKGEEGSGKVYAI